MTHGSFFNPELFPEKEDENINSEIVEIFPDQKNLRSRWHNRYALKIKKETLGEWETPPTNQGLLYRLKK